MDRTEVKFFAVFMGVAYIGLFTITAMYSPWYFGLLTCFAATVGGLIPPGLLYLYYKKTNQV